MERAEAIARLKLNREEVLQVSKKYKELSKYCQREVDALSYAIDTLEKGNNKTDKMEIIKFILVGLLGVILVKIGMDVAQEQRGYFAIGGEFFLLPLTYFVFYIIPALFHDFTRILKDYLGREEEDE